jgi:hypothetical protein
VVGHVGDQQTRQRSDCHVDQEAHWHVVGLDEIAESFLENSNVFCSH